VFEFYGLTRDRSEKWLRLRFDFEPEQYLDLLWRFECEFESDFHVRRLGGLSFDELGQFIESIATQLRTGVGGAELNDAYGHFRFEVSSTEEGGPVFGFRVNSGFPPGSEGFVTSNASEIPFDRDVLNELYRYLNQIRHTYA
jgi:hypothetical protein